jgi:putative methyltransferase (TIGR04325 family)
MLNFRTLVKTITPPFIINFYKFLFKKKHLLIWSGDYSSWEEAKLKCTGYESSLILQKCRSALLKVKNGEAIYERDGVVFNEIQYSWGLLAGLQRAAMGNKAKLCVLDFGGSLGSTYFQNKEFLNTLKELQWCIVEQKHFVDCGKENFEDEQLKFYYTVEECLAKHKPDVLLLSSVLQYLENPYSWIDKFISLNIPYIIVDRTAFVDEDADILTIQKISEPKYSTSYPAWFFGNKMQKLLKSIHPNNIEFFNNFTLPSVISGTKNVCWKGIIIF